MQWNSHTFVGDGPDAGPVWLVWGILWLKMETSGLGKISSRYFTIGEKTKIWRAVQDEGVSSLV